jgi:vacuolar iron transporter family protein
LIYEAKGLTEDEAKAIAAKLMADKDSALDALAREELGIDPQDLGGSAWAAAGTSFVLFAGGAIVPVTPFLFLTGTSAVVVSVLVSALALFLVGAAITLFTGRNVLSTGMRQLLFGAVAAGVTYSIGRLLGVTLAG